MIRFPLRIFYMSKMVHYRVSFQLDHQDLLKRVRDLDWI